MKKVDRKALPDFFNSLGFSGDVITILHFCKPFERHSPQKLNKKQKTVPVCFSKHQNRKMDPGYLIIFLLSLTIYFQKSQASAEVTKHKNTVPGFDEQVATIKTWVDWQDQEKFCFGLIVESSIIESGTY